MKILLTLLTLFTLTDVAWGRYFEDSTLIGARARPDVSAALEVKSTTKGFLPPRMTQAEIDAIVTPAIGLQVFNTDEGVMQVYDGLLFSSVGTANSFFRVTQTTHGRAIGFPLTPVYLTGGIWTDAKADSNLTLATHVIVQVIDVDNFVVAASGRYGTAGHGLSTETHYFVSELVSGSTTPIEPLVFSNPIIFVESATTTHIMPFRAFTTSGGGSSGGAVTSVFARSGAVVAVQGDYTGIEVLNVPAGTLSSTTTQDAINELDTNKLDSNSTLLALASFNSDGILVQTATSTFTSRAITASSSKVLVDFGDGILGNPLIDVDETQLDHDNLLNFVANEHIDWTASASNFSTIGTLAAATSTITGNLNITGLADGRDLSIDGVKLDGMEPLADVTDATNVAAAGAVMDSDFGANGLMIRTALGIYTNRSIVVGSTKLTVADGDGVAGNPTLDVDQTQLDHNLLLNYAADEHVDHTTVFMAATSTDDGLSGGGDISATRVFRVDINSLVLDATPDGIDEFMFFDIGSNFLRKTTLADIVAAVPVAGEANTASNIGAGAGVFQAKVGVDLRLRSISASSTKIIITEDPTEIQVDVDESNIDITALAGFSANNYLDHTLVNVNGGVGISGGGDLTANRLFDLDIPSITDETTVNDLDTIAIYDASAGAHREMTRANFLTGIVAAPVDSVFGRTGAVVAVQDDYTAGLVANVPTGTISATTTQLAIDELDFDNGVQDTTIAGKEDTIIGAATTITTLNLAVNRAVVSESNGKIAVATSTTAVEISYVNGVTSAIQTQLDTKIEFPEFAMSGGVSAVGGNSTKPAVIGHNNSNSGFTALKNGEIFGISVRLNAARTAGTCTASALINGVVQNGGGEETVIDAVDTQGNFQVIAIPIQYVAGDNLGMQTSTAGFTPTGTDAVITIWVRDR